MPPAPRVPVSGGTAAHRPHFRRPPRLRRGRSGRRPSTSTAATAAPAACAPCWRISAGAGCRGVSAEIGGITCLLLENLGERELWRTDGQSAAGTYRIRQLGPGERVEQLWPAGGKVYFALDTAETGSELWVTDGSAEGTRLVAEGRPGPAAGDPGEFRSLPDGRLVFAFTDDAHGREPWISDGSAAGTRLLEDVWPGEGGSSPSSFVPSPATGRLFSSPAGPRSSRVPTFMPFDFGPPPCPAEQLCLHNGRFEVAITWTAGGQSGQARRATASQEAGVFTFFSPDNWEVMVKVLDGCAINQHFWFSRPPPPTSNTRSGLPTPGPASSAAIPTRAALRRRP